MGCGAGDKGLGNMTMAAASSDWDNPAAPGIKLTSRTALANPARPLRRAQKPGEPFKSLEERERDETMAVALAQRARLWPVGAPTEDADGYAIKPDDPRLWEPFGAWCLRQRLSRSCYQAGAHYAEIIRQARNAYGLNVPGWAPSDGAYADLTDEQLRARKDLAMQRKRDADAVLRAVMPSLPAALERACYDQREPSAYDEAMIAHGLVMLAEHFGLRGTRRG